MKFNHISLPCEVPKLQQVTEQGSRVYVTPEGNKYPSVTTVLSAYNKQAIQEWRRRVGNEEANKISTRASSRGTRLHKLCEDYLNNEPVNFKTPLDQILFNSILNDLHRINNIYAQELRMYSDHLRIAGTVDCVAELDGKLTVIDFKTSTRPKSKDNIENYFMQATAYAIMFEERFSIPVSRTAVMIAIEDHPPQIFIEKRDTYVEQLLFYRNSYETSGKNTLINI